MADTTVWHEDDEFWKTLEPLMLAEERWEKTATEVDNLLSLLALQPDAAVLDLCCGPGRHSLDLARRGFRVTGVDRTEPYLREARARATQEGLDVEFVQGDMRHFIRAGAFEATIMMNTSFGYFADPAQNRQVLANVYQSLRDGGVLLIEMMGKEVLARIFAERGWAEKGDIIMLQERKVVNDWRWMENRWIFIQDGARREFKVTHWIYSAAEMADLLTACGFQAVNAYGDVEGHPYDHTARRLVVVARKG
jgi:SAM-dependent methyltransferase